MTTRELMEKRAKLIADQRALCLQAEIAKRDMTLMSYRVKATCNKGVWEGGEYIGDGDYAENDTEKQVCDLHEGV